MFLGALNKKLKRQKLIISSPKSRQPMSCSFVCLNTSTMMFNYVIQQFWQHINNLQNNLLKRHSN